MRILPTLLLLAALCPTAQALARDIEEVMSSFALSKAEISEIPHRQRFSNRKYVSDLGGEVYVSNEPIEQNAQTLKVGETQYVGANKGEWGGKLDFVRNGVTTTLMSGNIVHLELVGEGLYVFEGLAHLTSHQGSVYYIANASDPGVPRLVATLPDSPELVYVDRTRPDFLRFVIVGSMSVMSINHEYRELDILYWDAFWKIWLNPTSIVRSGDHYFIGLPHGVASIPAPFGPSSLHCKKMCTRVEFYVDADF